MKAHFTRDWFSDQLQHILHGWHLVLIQTSDSCAVWEHPAGIKNRAFCSRSGKQCDGVTRVLPALAAWTVQNEIPIALPDSTQLNPRQIIRDALVNGTNPQHSDFWGYADPNLSDQRQVEASLVAWTLWLARDWLFASLSSGEIAHIQRWLESCTVFMDHFGNKSLFVAVNHAARIALAEYGFAGSLEAVRRSLNVSDEVALEDGWLWDRKYRGVDYYNFWAYGSHHCYLRAMLSNWKNPALDRAMERHRNRLNDLPFLTDATGQNVLFGRSLAYRWAWLNGLVAAHYLGENTLSAGLSRCLLGRNIQRWIEISALDENGLFRERLSRDGSDGGCDSYITCGHPYWCMQSFLCLALSPNHAFWTGPAERLPVEQRDFCEPRQGPGMVFQGFRISGEVRLFNLRNLDHDGDALYEKIVYSSAFPCNAFATDTSAHHGTRWDNQFGLRLAEGVHVGPSKVLDLDVGDGSKLYVLLLFTHGAEFQATVRTSIHIDKEIYSTEHQIHVGSPVPENACWVEGGFAPGFGPTEPFAIHLRGGLGWVKSAKTGRLVFTENLGGWEALCKSSDPKIRSAGFDEPREPNILRGSLEHFVLQSRIRSGETMLRARHGAALDESYLNACEQSRPSFRATNPKCEVIPVHATDCREY